MLELVLLGRRLGLSKMRLWLCLTEQEALSHNLALRRFQAIDYNSGTCITGDNGMACACLEILMVLAGFCRNFFFGHAYQCRTVPSLLLEQQVSEIMGCLSNSELPFLVHLQEFSWNQICECVSVHFLSTLLFWYTLAVLESSTVERICFYPESTYFSSIVIGVG